MKRHPLSLLAAVFAAATAWLASSYAHAMDHSFINHYTNATSCTTLCHPSAAQEVMATTHWTWEHTDPRTGDKLGKNNVINNYCIAIASNEPRCTSCHVGLGYSDSSFNFSDASKVDCLICHDTTKTYKKFPTGSGHPVYGAPKEFPAGSGTMWYPPDLITVARKVGPTSRQTCGACHFFGGGGDAVKHGDLDSTMTNPKRDLDVHMGVDGADMTCADCHVVKDPVTGKAKHDIHGSIYTLEPGAAKLTCARCHTEAPHQGNPELNAHTAKVACQTCHIPAFARGGKATTMTWDWSVAGKKNAEGKPYIAKDAAGNVLYDTQKGAFTWGTNVAPSYVWYSGVMDYVTLDDVIDPEKIVRMNAPVGSLDDGRSRIHPVKHFTGRQPYDAGAKTLAVPHLFARNTNDVNAYWKSFDWDKALMAGMTSVGKTYSGQLGFVNTEMYWMQNHMVAPKEKALQCADCHQPGGRLDYVALGYPAERAAALQTISGFNISDVHITGSPATVVLRWQAVAGRTYKVQHSGELKTWADAATLPGPAVGTELSWQDPSATEGARYYRVIQTP